MDFQLNEEQRQLADSLERVLNDQYEFEKRRPIAAAGGSEAVWGTLGELGLFSIPVSEDHGGFGGGAVDLLRPMALVGRALVVDPVAAQLTGVRLLDRALTGSTAAAAARWQQVLGEAVGGSPRIAVVAPTGEQDGRVQASPGANGAWVLSGYADSVATTGVGDGKVLLVAASTPDGGRALFAIDAAGPGLTVTADTGLDRQAAARVCFDNHGVTATALLGTTAAEVDGQPARDGVGAAIEDALDFQGALLACEAVGLIEFACETTLEYLKTRKQFGVAIGSFQALQHRIVDLYVELEQVRSMAALSASKVDAAAQGQATAAERRRAVAAARVLVGKVADKVARESVQLHGGMGMAEELKVSHSFRRLTVLARQAGSVDWQLDRFIRCAA